MTPTSSNGTAGFDHTTKFSETAALVLIIMLGVSWDHGSHGATDSHGADGSHGATGSYEAMGYL